MRIDILGHQWVPDCSPPPDKGSAGAESLSALPKFLDEGKEKGERSERFSKLAASAKQAKAQPHHLPALTGAVPSALLAWQAQLETSSSAKDEQHPRYTHTFLRIQRTSHIPLLLRNAENAPTLAIRSVDTAENEHSKVSLT